MRAPLARLFLLFLGGWLTGSPLVADDPPAAPPKPTARPTTPMPALVLPVSTKDFVQERLKTDARVKELETPEAKVKLETKPVVELLKERLRLLGEWEKASKERALAEHPESSPEREAAENKADLEKAQALLDQASKSPDSLLPELFQAQPPSDKDSTKRSDSRLGDMKEAIDSARKEWKERSADLESLRAEGTRSMTAAVATLRTNRDKLHQEFVALTARRTERDEAVNTAHSVEARELARDRLINFEWETRVEAERLAAIEAQISLASQRVDLGTFKIQARAARVHLARKILELMENRYSAMADRQRSDLKKEVATEETRAAQAGDPLERRRAQRTVQLLEQESQVVAFEKMYATSGGLSLEEQRSLADEAEAGYAELRKMIDDGNVSPLDALRLKNDFRRITPERAQIVRTDLAASDAELLNYENALTDAEIDLVNDTRDDRFDRESLLDQVPERRRAEASAMFEDLETRHKTLLNRRRTVLLKLASRAEEVHKQVIRRIDTLDQEYAFIRTHIFWVRDAEPLGLATLAHARDESIRAGRAMVRLFLEAVDRSLWSQASVEFILAIAAIAVLPWPLRLAQKALDRIRLDTVPERALGLADFASVETESDLADG